MELVQKDILTIRKGIICHQVNCMGVMGSGIAKAIRDKWPMVYEDYSKVCSEIPPHQLLGMYQLVEVADQLYVCNLFGQFNYGRAHGKVYTQYDAFESSLLGLCNSEVAKNGLWVYVPYRIASNLAGGKWEEVEARIRNCEARTGTKIYICKKP